MDQEQYHHRLPVPATVGFQSRIGTGLLDIGPLLEALDDKRLLLLGENGHGVAEFHLLKRELVAFLHRHMGFDLLIFESGMAECFDVRRRAADLDAEAMITQSLYKPWHTREVLPLFEYVRQVASTRNPLSMIGLDVRPIRPDNTFLHDLMSEYDPVLARDVGEVERSVKRFGVRGFIHDEKELEQFRAWKPRFLDVYAACAGKLERVRQSGDPSDAVLVGEQVLRNRILFLDAAEDEERFYAFRENGMARNLEWILSVFHPAGRAIVWTHNDHARKAQSAIDGSRGMWELLDERTRRSSYVVGFHMYEGRATWNSGEEYSIAPAPDATLERRLHSIGGDVLFYNLSSVSAAGLDWPVRPATAMSWGMYPEEIVPAAQYDGLIFIDRVSAPERF